MSSDIRSDGRVREIGRLPGAGLRIEERHKDKPKKRSAPDKEEPKEAGETAEPKGKVDLRA